MVNTEAEKIHGYQIVESRGEHSIYYPKTREYEFLDPMVFLTKESRFTFIASAMRDNMEDILDLEKSIKPLSGEGIEKRNINGRYFSYLLKNTIIELKNTYEDLAYGSKESNRVYLWVDGFVPENDSDLDTLNKTLIKEGLPELYNGILETAEHYIQRKPEEGMIQEVDNDFEFFMRNNLLGILNNHYSPELEDVLRLSDYLQSKKLRAAFFVSRIAYDAEVNELYDDSLTKELSELLGTDDEVISEVFSIMERMYVTFSQKENLNLKGEVDFLAFMKARLNDNFEKLFGGEEVLSVIKSVAKREGIESLAHKTIGLIEGSSSTQSIRDESAIIKEKLYQEELENVGIDIATYWNDLLQSSRYTSTNRVLPDHIENKVIPAVQALSRLGTKTVLATRDIKALEPTDESRCRYTSITYLHENQRPKNKKAIENAVVVLYSHFKNLEYQRQDKESGEITINPFFDESTVARLREYFPDFQSKERLDSVQDYSLLSLHGLGVEQEFHSTLETFTKSQGNKAMAINSVSPKPASR